MQEVFDALLYEQHIKYVQTQCRNKNYLEKTEKNQIVVDYISTMTDDYFENLFKLLFPKSHLGFKHIGYFDTMNGTNKKNYQNNM